MILNPQEDGCDVQLPIYECLTPLRCVLAKNFSRQNFEIMMKMEQHTEQRKKEPFYQSMTPVSFHDLVLVIF
jgi:hypothetical protein